MKQIFNNSENAWQYFIRLTGYVGRTKILPFKTIENRRYLILEVANGKSFNLFVYSMLLIMTPFYVYRYFTLSEKENQNLLGVLLLLIFMMGFMLANISALTLIWKKREIAFITHQLMKLTNSGDSNFVAILS